MESIHFEGIQKTVMDGHFRGAPQLMAFTAISNADVDAFALTGRHFLHLRIARKKLFRERADRL